MAEQSADVMWKMGDDSWKVTTSSVREKMGIMQYRLYKRSGGIYSFRLEITTRKHGDYTFYQGNDNDRDSYTLTCHTQGDHSVDFNSVAKDDTFINRVTLT